MNARQTHTRKVAALLLKHAAWVCPAERKDWSAAMMNELDHIPDGTAALRWALGCAFVSYLERTRLMARPLTILPRWLLALEMAVCFIPVTFLFLVALNFTLRGRMALEYSLLYGSGTLVGPLGLIATLSTLLRKTTAVSRSTMTTLAVLATWTLIAYSGQLLHVPVSQWWREFILIALLPALAVAHLIQINSERRKLLVAA